MDSCTAQAARGAMQGGLPPAQAARGGGLRVLKGKDRHSRTPGLHLGNN